MLRGSNTAAGVTSEVRAALERLFVYRGRLLMLLGIGAAIVFIAATRAIGSARGWSDGMNLAVAALLAAALVLTRLPIVQRHMAVLCVLVASLAGLVRALAGIWHGDVAATAIFMVVLAMLLAATLPWGLWPQFGVACTLGGGVAIDSMLVTGGIGPESGRLAANVVLGLGGSVLLAAETRHHHIRLLVDRFKRRDAEAALVQLNSELEHRIEERTAELKRAEQAALQHQADLAHVLRLGTMGEMTAGLAHEINQPLGAIANYALGCARRLRDGAIDADALLPIVEQIGAEALRAGEIIRRLRELVRKDAIRQAPADINHLVRESVRLIEPEARARNVALHLELAPALPAVACNDIQIEQVLLNLLLNGVEAVALTENGRRTLSVRTTLAGDIAEVAVSDSGVGLPEPPADVFAPFYTTKASGLGMGLSISRSIIEAHGGRLWSTRNPEHGATFHFTLPL